MTQAQVAERIGVTRAAVGLWESSGQVATDNLIRVCAVLGIEVQSAVEGVVKPEIWPDKLSEMRSRFAKATTRFEALRPRISVAARAAEHPAHVLTSGFSQPVYIIRPPKSDDGNIQISTKPAFLVERKRRYGSDRQLYLAAIGTSVLEPKIPNKSFAVVSPFKLAEVGDLVLVMPPQDIEKIAMDMLEAIEFQVAWVGEMVSINAAEITLRQFKPSLEVIIPLDRIGVMHTLHPDD